MKFLTAEYRKFQIALGAAIAQYVLVAADGVVTTHEWETVGLAALAAFGVVFAKNG